MSGSDSLGSGEVMAALPNFRFLFKCVCVAVLSAAQGWAPCFSQTVPPPSSWFPPIGNIIENNVPGLANPLSPFVFPPYFQGEAKARPAFSWVTEKTFRAPHLGISLDLDKDLGYDNDFIVIELMVRAQAANLSLRAHYDAYASFLSTDRNSHLDWPPFRVGADWDFLNRNSLRFGANVDVTWDQPKFGVQLPLVGTQYIKWNRPITAGIHAAFNPPGRGGLSFSFDTRARWPVIDKTRVTEFEIAGGVRTPETVLGSTAVRAGWRYTIIDLRTNDPFEMDLTWSGVFGELVYFY